MEINNSFEIEVQLTKTARNRLATLISDLNCRKITFCEAEVTNDLAITVSHLGGKKIRCITVNLVSNSQEAKYFCSKEEYNDLCKVKCSTFIGKKTLIGEKVTAVFCDGFKLLFIC